MHFFKKMLVFKLKGIFPADILLLQVCSDREAGGGVVMLVVCCRNYSQKHLCFMERSEVLKAVYQPAFICTVLSLSLSLGGWELPLSWSVLCLFRLHNVQVMSSWAVCWLPFLSVVFTVLADGVWVLSVRRICVLASVCTWIYTVVCVLPDWEREIKTINRSFIERQGDKRQQRNLRGESVPRDKGIPNKTVGLWWMKLSSGPDMSIVLPIIVFSEVN